MAEVKLEQHSSHVEPVQIKEEPELSPKQEPEEFPLHIITVKTEEDHSSSDTDRSEDYSQEQAEPRRSYAMVAADSQVWPRPGHRCCVCEKAFTQRYSLTSHMRIHTGEKPFVCSVCDKPFTRKNELTLHTRRAHTGERPYACSLCDKRFLTKYTLTQHQRAVHGMCPACERCFPDETKLKSHLRSHVEEGTLDPASLRSFSCSECGKSFGSQIHLQKHAVVHTGARPFLCSVCDKSFTQKGSMTAHIRRIHMGQKPHCCSVCEERFYRKYQLTLHQKTVHHICPLCTTRFPDERELKEHQRSHEEDTAVELSFLSPYSCSECGESFPLQLELKRHMSFHSGERPHRCPLCHKLFTTRNLLTIHTRRVHHQEPPDHPHQEGSLRTLFTSRNLLTIHTRRVHSRHCSPPGTS